MHSDNNNTVELEIFIKDTQLNNLDIFSKSYTMREHFSDAPRKEGKQIAKEKFPTERVAVHVQPISDLALENAIRTHLKLHTSEKLFPRVHNPMCASFCSYEKTNIMGKELLIMIGTTGTFYAEINHEWQLEFQSNLNS